MNKIEKSVKEVKRLIAKADTNDEIVCCENGVETNNTYPMWALNEVDMKSPIDWVHSIYFLNTITKKNCEISFKLRKA